MFAYSEQKFMPKSRLRKTVLFAAAAVYFALTASFHFFHSETTVSERSDCPACQFNSSNSSPVPFAVFEPPPPSFLDWTPVRAEPARGVTLDVGINTRAPPLV